METGSRNGTMTKYCLPDLGTKKTLGETEYLTVM